METQAEQILVSIATSSSNQGRFIEETILSVKNHDCRNIQHMIMDVESGRDD